MNIWDATVWMLRIAFHFWFIWIRLCGFTRADVVGFSSGNRLTLIAFEHFTRVEQKWIDFSAIFFFQSASFAFIYVCEYVYSIVHASSFWSLDSHWIFMNIVVWLIYEMFDFCTNWHKNTAEPVYEISTWLNCHNAIFRWEITDSHWFHRSWSILRFIVVVWLNPWMSYNVLHVKRFVLRSHYENICERTSFFLLAR